jgi:hypothetical protein
MIFIRALFLYLHRVEENEMIELSEQEKIIIRRWANIVIREYSEDGFLPISLEQRAERQIARGILVKMGEEKTTNQQINRPKIDKPSNPIKIENNKIVAIVMPIRSENGYCSVVTCQSRQSPVKEITVQYLEGDQVIELCNDCWQAYRKNADANGITLTYPTGERH